MSAKIHFYLRTDRPTKDGSSQIVLLFIIGRTRRLKISTGKYIPLKKEYNKLTATEIKIIKKEKPDSLYYWDELKERASKGFSGWENKNKYLGIVKLNQFFINTIKQQFFIYLYQ